MIQPIVVEPVPTPVSNAARIAPKAAPRLAARTSFIRAHVDRIRRAEAEAEEHGRQHHQRPCAAGGQACQARAEEDEARDEDALEAQPIPQPPRERPDQQNHDRQRRQVDRLWPARREVGVERREAQRRRCTRTSRGRASPTSGGRATRGGPPRAGSAA